MSTTDRRTSASTLVLLASLLLGAALRFWRIGHQSFWYDESVTVGLLHHSLGGMLDQLPKLEGTPPLYYCLAWLWTRMFGLSEVGVRSLSALAGILLIAVIYGIGAKLISRRAGVIAAALAACNPFLIWYGQEARAYSLLALMVSLSLLCFAHLLELRPRAGWVVAWALACAAALATHYYAIVAVAPEAAWLAWLHRRDPRLWYAITVVAVAGLALIPLAVKQKGNTAWIAMLPLGSRLAQIPAQFVRGTGAPAEPWLDGLGAAAVAAGIGLLLARASARERTGSLTALGIAAAGLGLALALVVFGVDYVISRNLIAVLLSLIVGLAGGLGSARARVAGPAAAAVLCTVGVIATLGVNTDWRLQRPDWRGVAQVAGITNPRPAAGHVVIIENIDSLEPLGLYAPALHVLPPAGARAESVTLIAATRGPYGALCWWGAACHVDQARLYTALRLPGFGPAGPIRRVNQFAVYRLISAHPTRITRGRLERALEASSLRSYALLGTN